MRAGATAGSSNYSVSISPGSRTPLRIMDDALLACWASRCRSVACLPSSCPLRAAGRTRMRHPITPPDGPAIL
jgi:hypothetical protein